MIARLRMALCKHDLQNGRDEQQRLIQVCVHQCGYSRRVLSAPVLRGPKADPDQVLGTPLAKATRITRDNTIEFPRQSER